MITDAQLKAAAGELETAMITALPDAKESSHEFSASFAKKMKKVVFRANHPFVSRLGQRVAAMILVIFLLGSSVLIICPSARAAFFGWLKEVYATAMHYNLTDCSAPDAVPTYHLGWLPEEYTLQETIEDFKEITYIYNGGSNNLLVFSYLFSPDGSGVDAYFEIKDHTHKAVTVGDLPADLYLSINAEQSNALVWQSEDGTVLFYVKANLDPAELLQIAENVAAGKNN